MNLGLLFRTVSHLKLQQVYYQIRHRVSKPKYVQESAPTQGLQLFLFVTPPIAHPHVLGGESFEFLNIRKSFSGWCDVSDGMLWVYNLNYFDYLNQPGIKECDGIRWIDDFIDTLSANLIGLDPYPTALRIENWIKFFCRFPSAATTRRISCLYSQYRLLQRSIEKHLLGNHLLEDYVSLYIASLFFADISYHHKVYEWLQKELSEEILPDGGHFEQSPMYHCILLGRLLDCINVKMSFEKAESELVSLKIYASKMLGYLEAICFSDYSWPIFNDAAIGIAPTPVQIFDYAKRLGLVWSRGELGESGYRKLTNGKIEAFVDCGQIAASYQPGHSHADALNYEIRIDGQPVVVDTGISTYDKTPRRLYERSTIAHNCVSVEGRNSDEVWSGFRVGRQCKVSLLNDEKNVIIACHDGFGKKCYRKFELLDDKFCIEDHFDGEAISYVHLADGVNPGRVMIEGASKIDVLDTRYSIEYNRFIENKTLAIHFNGKLRYEIH